MPHRATQRRATPHRATPRNATQRRAALCRATQRRAAPHRATPRNAAPRNAAPRRATQRNATPRRATPRWGLFVAKHAANSCFSMSETVLHSLVDYQRAIVAAPRVLLFKHSPVCPISAVARVEYDAFCVAQPEAVTLFVDVIDDRSVARGLAELCCVKHQSPQAILFLHGKPCWHASHQAITVAELTKAWRQA
jgi:bacillithiol system protein YtxJ